MIVRRDLRLIVPHHALEAFVITKTVISTPWVLLVLSRNSVIPRSHCYSYWAVWSRSFVKIKTWKQSYHFLVCKPTMILHFLTREVGFRIMLLRFCTLGIYLEIFLLCLSLSAGITYRELILNLCRLKQDRTIGRIREEQPPSHQMIRPLTDLPISRFPSAPTILTVPLNLLQSRETSHTLVTFVFKNNIVVKLICLIAK